ncbi:Cof-type HAD-IIB family hydrolase [Kozakia baliensis]|uniref:Cof-type HAD-IIB family hydrolase n=1 Tax=Kozakia baliensis TaxID=153496 RepID=UPI000495E141|nr:Cof-type HAD-IIB family hydrolase [Kozakia baliensis]AOX19245.1 hydrolase [Kozakia baliensis]
MTIDLDAVHDTLAPMAKTIRLVVSDIDGTLVGPDKQLSPATISAAQALQRAGIALCLVSSRSAPGVAPFVSALHLQTPYAALNGGMVLSAKGDILSSLTLSASACSAACDMLDVHHVDAWLFRGHDWLVRDPAAPYVGREQRAVKLTPKVVPDFKPYYDGVGKIMGSSSDYPLLERLEIEIGAMLKGEASVHRSSNYYLDITHRDANKGYAARALAKQLGVDMSEVACIGDMSNDVPMLKIAGLGIAMGNASEEIRAQAHVSTGRNDADGWAQAMQEYVLPRAPSPNASSRGETQNEEPSL